MMNINVVYEFLVSKMVHSLVKKSEKIVASIIGRNLKDCSTRVHLETAET